MSVGGAYRRMTTALMLPSKIVEEGLHAAVIWPWAESIGIWIEPDTGTAGVDVVAPDAPGWALWLTLRAPQIAGVVLALAALAALANGIRPDGTVDLLGALCASFWWVKLVAPEQRPDGSQEAGDAE